MKYLANLLKTKHILLLGLCVFIALLLHMRSIDFPCFNSDEASFAYNAYSILETGKDEYGKILPTRFQAFGENKLPVTIYSIVPFIGMFGMNELAARLPFILIGVLMPLLFYWLAESMFKNKTIAIIAALLASVSPWIQIMSRHIHEDVLMLVLTILILQLFIKLAHSFSFKTISLLAFVTGLSLFTYHIGKVLAVFVVGWLLFLAVRQKISFQKISKSFLIILIPILIFGLTEVMNPSSRISNLLFTSDKGFSLTIDSLRNEHNSRTIHNKFTYGMQLISNQYLSYFSPEFLVSVGDRNQRFGSPGVSPLSPVEYVFFFVGVYFIVSRKEKHTLLLSSLLLIAPLTAALSWQVGSLTRSYLMIIPLLLSASYGMYWAVKSVEKKLIQIVITGIIATSLLFFVGMSWDYYYHHYPMQVSTSHAWQCGYKELGSYINNSYDRTDKYYITKRHGQPYIFTLFYTAFPPSKYQPQASLTELGEYGFGEVESYDKFVFSFKSPDEKTTERTSYIGYPEDFNGTGIGSNDIEKVTINGADLFWIYEINK
ncbi:MAG: glycosyltransferase family 39 protein [bacterium]|nr:glycosyltransferase family 39 protein [bacterium]